MPKKVAIIGSGIAGLSLFKALSDIKQQVDIEPILFTNGSFEYLLPNQSSIISLWKGGIQACEALDIDISSIAHPITQLTSEILDLAPNVSPRKVIEWPNKPATETPICQAMGHLDMINLVASQISEKNPDADFRMDHTLQSYRISSETGSISLIFSNGYQEDDFFQVFGCDGPLSTCRSLLMNDRLHPQSCLQLVLSGTSPRHSSNQEIQDGIMKIYHCPGGIHLSLMGMGDFVNWIVVSPQKRDGEFVQSVIEPLRRSNLHLPVSDSVPALSPNPVSALHTYLGEFRGSIGIDSNECVLLAKNILSPFFKILPSNIPKILETNLEGCSKAYDSIAHEAGEDWWKSFTSPLFHPGRVILVGSACHTLDKTFYGDRGACLSLNSVLALKQLISQHLSPEGIKNVDPRSLDEQEYTSIESRLLKKISKEYDLKRLDVSKKVMSDTHHHALFNKTGTSIIGMGSSLFSYFGSAVMGTGDVSKDGWNRGDTLKTFGEMTVSPAAET